MEKAGIKAEIMRLIDVPVGSSWAWRKSSRAWIVTDVPSGRVSIAYKANANNAYVTFVHRDYVYFSYKDGDRDHCQTIFDFLCTRIRL